MTLSRNKIYTPKDLPPTDCATHLASWSRQLRLYRFSYSTRNLEILLTRVVQSRFPCSTKHASPSPSLHPPRFCSLRTKISLSSFRRRNHLRRDLSATLRNEVTRFLPPSRRGTSVFPVLFSFFFSPSRGWVVSRRSALKIRNKTRRAVAGGKMICGRCGAIRRFNRNFMNL